MKKCILFVDDEPKVLDGIRRMLRPMRKEWETFFAPGGEEALATLGQRRFDVVVTDMRMPGMNGAQLLAEVKRRHPETVRIVLSGHSERETILRSVGPAHQYLAKPCDPERLRNVITRACDLRDLLGEDSLRELTSRMSTIPSLPETYEEIVAELQSPDSSITRIGEIVAKDAGMTAKILQLVNSAFFGLRHHVSNPSQAASFLGVDILKALVLSVHIFSQLDHVKIEGFCLETLWHHSAATGTLAKRIAATQDDAARLHDHAFLAGLLHDAGKLVLAANLPEQYREVLVSVEDEGLEVWEAERKRLANTHAEVGAYLLGLWGLPDPIVEAVAYHHDPSRCPGDGFTPLTAVHVANALEHEADDAPENRDTSRLDTDYLTRIGLAEGLAAWRALYESLVQEETSQ